MSKEKASSRINNKIGGSGAPKKKSSPVMILFPLLIVVAVIGGVIFVLSGKEPEAKEVVITPENVEEIIAEQKEESKTPIGSYETAMTTKWHFPDGSSASTDAYVENAVVNRNTVYFTVSLADTDEEIYKSPFLKVGDVLTEVTLDKELTAGTYKAVLTYHLVDSSNEDVGRVSVGITLIIEN